jgi:hypothetical protein
MNTLRKSMPYGKTIVALAVTLTGVALTPSPAHTQALTFEGLSNGESVNDYYNGGTGSEGSSGGPNYGINFSSNSLAEISDQDGGGGNFNDTPVTGPTIVFFLGGSAATLNAAGGFSTGFSFDYSAINYSGFINIYSGLNETGTLLTTLSLPVTPSPQPGRFNPFVPIGVSFDGIAHSVDFGGSVNQIGFDNITVNSTIPGSPEPSPAVVLTIGILSVGSLMLYARRHLSQSAKRQAD